MKGSSDRATASLPPFHSALRASGSPSLVPATHSCASCSGDFLPSTRRTKGSSAPSSSRIFYRIPRATHPGAQRGLRSDEGAQLVFLLLLGLHQRGIEQGLQLADQRLVAVLDAEQVVFSDARRFGPELAVLLEDAALLGE